MTVMSKTPQWRNLPQVIILSLLCVFLPASGCASKYGAQKTAVKYYPDCYQPINELRRSEYAVERGAAGGAVAGALLGALVGYLATGKAKGAAAGAAVGGVAGGVAGGAAAHYSKDDDARLAEYNAELDGGIREVDKATAAAKVCRQCYERQFAVAAKEYKEGYLTKAQFNERYQEVASGMEEAAYILGTANENSSKVAADYRRAVQEEEARVAQSSSPAQRQPQRGSSSGKTTPKPTSSGQGAKVADLKQKSKDMDRSVSASEEEERLLRERLAATHQQAKDLMS